MKLPWYLRGRYLAGHLTLLAVVFGMVNLGFWQLRRLDQRRATNHAIVVGQSAVPIPAQDAMPQLASPGPSSQEPQPTRSASEWTVITVTGVFDQSQEVLVRARSLNGRPGLHVLTPLVLDDKTVVIVNRGWVPYTIPDQRPLASIAPTAGRVTVTGRLRPSQTRSNQPPTGDLNSADVVEIGRRTTAVYKVPAESGYEAVRRGYLEQITPASDTFPTLIPLPSLDEGPHFSYAMQWFTFSLLGLIIWPLFMRKAARERARVATAGPTEMPANIDSFEV